MQRSLFLGTISILALLVSSVGWAHPGWGIVRNTKGETFFCDVNRNIIWKIDNAGRTTAFVHGKHSHELFIDGRDNLYGVHVEYDQRNSRWLTHRWVATPAGVVRALGPGESDDIFSLRDGRGNLYLYPSDAHRQEARIITVSPAGDTVLLAGGVWGDRDGKGASAQFRNFGPAFWGRDSALYVGSGGLVRRIALDGTVTTVIGTKHGFGDPAGPNASGILGIAFDDKNNLYAASWERNVVVKVSSDGRVSTVLKSGTFWSPSGVLIAGGDLYVLEHRSGMTIPFENIGFGGPRIRKISSDGMAVVVGTAR